MTGVKQSPLRPIHYLGSKLRLLDFIQEAVDGIDPTGGVCDLFAGSGSVAYKLSQHHKVTAVDIQEYSRVLCSALLLKPEVKVTNTSEFINESRTLKHNELLAWAMEPMIGYETLCTEMDIGGNPEPLCELIEKGSIIAFESTQAREYSAGLLKAFTETVRRLHSSRELTDSSAIATRYFGGLYFSYAQAVDLDSLLYNIFRFEASARNIYLAAILSTASDVVNTVGKQFAQPIKPRNVDGTPKKNLGKMLMKDRTIDTLGVFKQWLERYSSLKIYENKHVVYRKDYSEALDLLDSDTKIIYADPPYTRDHYSRFYHVLETLCLRDNPSVSTTLTGGVRSISRGIYRENRHQSPFCIKSQAPDAFDTLFSKSRNLNATLLLSYSPYDESANSHPRLLTIKELKKIANRYYRHIEIVTPGGFSHSKLNSTNRHLPSSKVAELLMICSV